MQAKSKAALGLATVFLDDDDALSVSAALSAAMVHTDGSLHEYQVRPRSTRDSSSTPSSEEPEGKGVTEEEVHLCRAVAAGHYFFFFFGAVGEGNIEVKVQEAGTVLLILGTMLGGGTFCSDTRRTPFPLLVAAGLQWKGEKGQATAMKAV